MPIKIGNNEKYEDIPVQNTKNRVTPQRQALLDNFSDTLPKDFTCQSYSGRELIDFLQSTGLMYQDGYLEGVEERLKYLDWRSMYKSDANFFIFYKNKIIGFTTIKINPSDASEARFMSVAIDENYRKKGFGNFLIQERFKWLLQHPSIKRVMVSNFTDDGKNYLVRQYVNLSKKLPDVEIYVSDDFKEKKLLQQYVEEKQLGIL